MRGLELVEHQAHTTDNEIRRRVTWGDSKQLNWEGSAVGPENESIVVELGEAELKRLSAADCIEVWLVGSIESKRGVVSVEQDDGTEGYERLHGGGLLGIGADGDEPAPVLLCRGAAGAVFIENGGGYRDCFDDGM